MSDHYSAEGELSLSTGHERTAHRLIATHLPAWTVATLTDRSAAAKDGHTALEAVVTHNDTSSHLQLSPHDPEKHLNEQTVYSAHRLRLRNTVADESRYITLSDEGERLLNGHSLQTLGTAMETVGTGAYINQRRQQEVHHIDEARTNSGHAQLKFLAQPVKALAALIAGGKTLEEENTGGQAALTNF